MGRAGWALLLRQGKISGSLWLGAPIPRPWGVTPASGGSWARPNERAELSLRLSSPSALQGLLGFGLRCGWRDRSWRPPAQKLPHLVAFRSQAATVSDVRPSTLAKAIEGESLTEELAATLAAKIGSASVSWVREFVKAGGLRNLASGLVFSTSKRRTRTTIAALDAVAAAFHNTSSRSLAKAVRRHDALINAVAGTLASRTPELRRRALQVLTDVAAATSQSHA